MENIIVGIIILAAAAFAAYRLFFRPGCGCGCDCAVSCKQEKQGCCGDKSACGCGR